MAESSLEAREEALAALTRAERYALDYLAQNGQAEMSPATSDRLFELFLRGMPCDEIRRQNAGFTLGQIVHARIRDGWDLRKEEHDRRLVEEARANAQRIGLEAVEFIGKLLAASHKLHLDQIHRFLQSGNPEDLGDLRLNMKQYKEGIDLLMKLTGQEGNRKVQGEVRHVVQGAPGAPPAPAAGAVPGTPLTPEQASLVLRALAGEG